MAITIIVTNAGRAALVNAVNTGTNAVTITQLGITEAVFVPTAAQVALPGEIKRIPLASGVVVADDQIHVTASDVTADAYAMRGFALYLNDGTLFAIYGQAGAILNKTAQSMMLLAADISFADIDAELIEFGDTNFILPPATTEILGLVELATTAEGQAGADASRVLTPLTGKQSVLGWLLSQDGSGSGLDADLLDGLHASAFALAGHTHGTMATQNANNVAITGGALNGVTLGTVNGSAASPALSFTADPDTGLYRAATNALAISTGGVERARMDAAGNLGIGAIPSYPLDVSGGSADAQTLVARFSSLTADSSTRQALNIYASPVVGKSIIQSYRGAAEGDLSFYCGNNERLALTANGQLQLFQGTPSAPGLSFLVDSDTGIYRGSPDTLGFVTAGVARAYFSNDGRFLPNANGSYDVGATVARWRNVNATGLDLQTSAGSFIIGPAGSSSVKLSSSGTMQYDVAPASTHQFLVNGAEIASLGAGGFEAAYVKTTAWGTAANPAVAIGGYTNGLFNDTSSRLGFSIGGARVARLDAAFLIPGEDTTMDLGIPTYRWKTGNFSTAVVIAGNAAWHAGNDGSGSGLDADLLDGQHGSYYLPAASYTAADVRAKLLTVDGAGTGIDADLLDGQHGSYYLPAATFSGAQVLSRLQTVDGSGSGLDADMLDGFHASDFRRIVDQNLSEYDGYRVWSDGTKECWTRMVINENQSKTWALPVAHTAWVHPALAISTAAISDVQDNTGITSINGAPPYSITFWNADNRTLTIWVRTFGV